MFPLYTAAVQRERYNKVCRVLSLSLFSKRTTPYSCVDMSEFSSKYIQTARKGCITLLFLREKGQQQLIRMNSVHPLLYWCCCLLASPNPPGFCFQNWNVKIKSIERIDDLSSASTSIDSFFFSLKIHLHTYELWKKEREIVEKSLCVDVMSLQAAGVSID